MPWPKTVKDTDYTLAHLYVCTADTEMATPRLIKSYYLVDVYRLPFVHKMQSKKAVTLGNSRWGYSAPDQPVRIFKSERSFEFTEIEDVPMPKRFKNLEWRNGSWGRWKPTRKWEIVT